MPCHIHRLPDRDVGRRKPARQQRHPSIRQPGLERAIAFGQPLGLEPGHHRRTHAVFIQHDMLLGQRRRMLADGFGKMHPDQPAGAFRVTRRAAQPGGREPLAQDLGDGAGFPQGFAVDLKARDPANRVQRQIFRRAQALVEGMRHDIEPDPKLVQQPQAAHRPGLGTVMQPDHAPPPPISAASTRAISRQSSSEKVSGIRMSSSVAMIASVAGSCCAGAKRQW